MIKRILMSVVALGLGMGEGPAAESAGGGAEDRGVFAQLAANANARQASAIAGQNGWLFLTAELRHLGVDRFWGADAPKVSRSEKPEFADPLPAILDFHQQLKRAGIELILVPVPAKAALYPHQLLTRPVAEAGKARADAGDAAFLRICTEQGIGVVDLVPAFQRARDAEPSPLYCKTDSHWSGRGCVVTAELLSQSIRTRAWFQAVPKRTYKQRWKEVEIRGDLADLVEPKSAPEQVRLRVIDEEGGGAPGDWRESPVLLLGDSHTLVFHSGEDMHGTGAGLADQLAFELGFPVDVIGVRGSGATPARINLFRRKDNLAGKKLVIWCFSAREFTEATGGWRLVPVVSSK